MELEKPTGEDPKQEVARIIREAFAGVTLGDCRGLWAGQVLDDWCSPEAIADYRANHERDEEQQDWSRIPAADLERCDSSLCFFDAEGMRFHLPAFMLAKLDDENESEGEWNTVIFSLTMHILNESSTNDYNRKMFSLLDAKQRMAIRTFLLYCKGHPDYEFEVPDITRALDEYWLEGGVVPPQNPVNLVEEKAPPFNPDHDLANLKNRINQIRSDFENLMEKLRANPTPNAANPVNPKNPVNPV